MKDTPERFNDGKLFYGKIQTIRERGKRTGEEFIPVLDLYFNEMNLRQRDIDVATSSDQHIDIKVKTQYVPGISKDSHKVKIEEEIYDIYQIDWDSNRRYLYWYLAKVERNG